MAICYLRLVKSRGSVTFHEQPEGKESKWSLQNSQSFISAQKTTPWKNRAIVQKNLANSWYCAHISESTEKLLLATRVAYGTQYHCLSFSHSSTFTDCVTRFLHTQHVVGKNHSLKRQSL